MGIIKKEEIICWDTPAGIFCNKCVGEADGKPLTEDDLSKDDVIVICDQCGEKIWG